MQRNFTGQEGYSQRNGDTYAAKDNNPADKSPFSKTRENKIVGEYIDFEEID